MALFHHTDSDRRLIHTLILQYRSIFCKLYIFTLCKLITEIENMWSSLFDCQGVLNNPLLPSVLRYKMMNDLQKKRSVMLTSMIGFQFNYSKLLIRDNRWMVACFIFWSLQICEWRKKRNWAQPWHLEVIWPENNSLLRKKNTKEIITNHKGTRMVKDGED